MHKGHPARHPTDATKLWYGVPRFDVGGDLSLQLQEGDLHDPNVVNIIGTVLQSSFDHFMAG